MSERVVLKIDGKAYEGWTSVSVSRAINCLCASFQLSLVDRNPGETDRSAIRDQAACEVWLADELFITGYIFDIDAARDSGQHTITVSGRDKTGDLIDCSAVKASGSWKGQKLEAIARDLIAPFGLKLRLDADTGDAFALFALEQGESVFEAITRMCRMRGVMVDTDNDATLVIFKPSDARAQMTFEMGRNIKTLRLRSSSADRFSSYIVKGQHHGGSYVSASDAALPKGDATDAGVTRYRPLVILSDEQSTKQGLKTRALWEATTRLGRALEASVVIQGWRDDAGKLLAPNLLARLVSEPDGIDADMMMASIDFTLDEGGTVASIGLARPESFTTEALLEPKKKKARKGKGDGNWQEALTNG